MCLYEMEKMRERGKLKRFWKEITKRNENVEQKGKKASCDISDFRYGNDVT